MTLEEFLLKLNELRAVMVENLAETDFMNRDRTDVDQDWVLMVDMLRAIDHVKALSTQLMGYFLPEEAEAQ